MQQLTHFIVPRKLLAILFQTPYFLAFSLRILLSSVSAPLAYLTVSAISPKLCSFSFTLFPPFKFWISIDLSSSLLTLPPAKLNIFFQCLRWGIPFSSQAFCAFQAQNFHLFFMISLVDKTLLRYFLFHSVFFFFLVLCANWQQQHWHQLLVSPASGFS